MKIPSVVSINSASKVAEIAAQKFNEELIYHLVRGATVGQSFEFAINKVKGCKDVVHKSCCCEHEHTLECLWRPKAIKDLTNAHNLHS